MTPYFVTLSNIVILSLSKDDAVARRKTMNVVRTFRSAKSVFIAPHGKSAAKATHYNNH